jgi:transposase
MSSRTVEEQIVDLHRLGRSYHEIRAELGVGFPRVQRAITEYLISGRAPPPSRRGRPRIITEPIVDFISFRTLEDASLPATSLAGEIGERFNVTITPRSITGMRAKLKFKYQPPRHVQLLTDSHIAQRVDFCRKYLEMPDSLPLIHFSDESRIVLGDDKRWVWYRRGENNPSANVSSAKFPPSLMVFAVIGIGYKSRLLLVDGTINTEKYIENLEALGFIQDLNAKHGQLQWIFQQDGAPCHTSAAAIEWLEGLCDIIPDWPPNSPDLSPIELLWAIMKRIVWKLRATTIPDLKHALQVAWDLIPQSTIDALCLSFHSRLQICLEQGGDSISNLLGQVGEKDAMRQFTENAQVRVEWTSEEDTQLYRLVKDKGPRWKWISKMFPNRNTCQVKNRWYTLKRQAKERTQDVDDFLEFERRLRSDDTDIFN